MKKLIFLFSLLLFISQVNGQVLRSSGNYVAPVVAGGAPSFLTSDGHTVGWYISDAANVHDDGAGVIHQWSDVSGNNRHLLATTTARPTWSTTGITFDGTANTMRVEFAWVQPEFIYIVFKQITWTDGRRIFDGINNNRGILHQKTTTPDLVAYAGGSSGAVSPTLDTYCIVRLLFNGASSKMILNGNAAVTGNFGSFEMEAFVLGSAGEGGNFSNIQVKEIILRNQDDGAGTEEAAIMTYLNAKYTIY
jgi:hypothetical protein